MTRSWMSIEGSPYPLGVSWIAEEQAYNFAVYSKHAETVTLLLFDQQDTTEPIYTFEFDYLTHKSGRIWHCRVPKARIANVRYYAYRISGPEPKNQAEWHNFDSEKVLLDPYAKEVYFPPGFSRQAAIQPGSNLGKSPLGVVYEDEPAFDWGSYSKPKFHESDLIIYELHVRGFTQRENSGVSSEHRGRFEGIIEKIPYLKQLGITCVELMPVYQFDPQEGNYWGYMPLNFFAPHNAYASNPRDAHNEFRRMVKALHEADIEIILDVVFNHTAEGNHNGPCYSFKGIDNSTYYMMTGNPQEPYMNYSGTGNTLHCANRYVRRMILDSLRHWVKEMRVDGFRFDLASVFARKSDGSIEWDDPPIIGAIRADPDLGNVRLIAEPWDAGGLYQLGRNFPGSRWFQWNGRFRDDVRRAVRGDEGMIPNLMRRLYGSDDLFPDAREAAYHPYQSVNYICSHDGFTMYDQVSYNERHNWANGHYNTDGHRENYSWNCGWEGDAGVPPDVVELRKRQLKNFCALLFLSNGTPMLYAGDEFMHTQFGNNNPYNQDNVTTWLDWDRFEQNQDIFRFFSQMIAFRKAHPSLCRSRFWRKDVRWFGTTGEPDLSPASRTIAFYLDGASQADDDLYVMINLYHQPLSFTLQMGSHEQWHRVIDTSQPSPQDILAPGEHWPLSKNTYSVQGRSVVVFLRRRAL